MSRRQKRDNMRTDPRQIAPLIGPPVENWREIADYPGYFVSDRGRVCSVDRVVIRGNGVTQLCRGTLLRPGPSASGHLSVCLTRYNSKSVHALVLAAFVGPAPEGHEALHGDDDPTNNVLSNLRWGTRSENLHDAIRNGKTAIGEDKPQAKLTEDRVRWIRANSQYSMNSLAMRLGVSCAAVKQVLDGVTWKHVI